MDMHAYIYIRLRVFHVLLIHFIVLSPVLPAWKLSRKLCIYQSHPPPWGEGICRTNSSVKFSSFGAKKLIKTSLCQRHLTNRGFHSVKTPSRCIDVKSPLGGYGDPGGEGVGLDIDRSL